MTIIQFFTILNARKLSLLFVFCTILGLAIVYVLMIPKTYTAINSVLVNFNEVDPSTGLSVPGQLLTGYMATQIDIITSHNVALKVVENLHLLERQENTEKLNKLDKGINAKDWFADELIKNLDVKPSKDSSVINIAYSGQDPKSATELANAFANAFIQASLELKVAPAKTETEWFNQQTRGLRDAVEVAQQRLSEYQQETGMVAPDEKLDLESARLAELSNELVKAQSETYDSQTRQKQLVEATKKGRLEEIPDIQNSVLIQGLKSELSRSEAKLAEMSQGMNTNHPQIQRLRAENMSIRQKISTEIQTAKGAISKTATQVKMKESEIEKAFARQKNRVLELKKQHDRIVLLKREVENTQKSYDMARQHTEQIRLESQRNQTEIAILNSAVTPIKPSKPNKLFTISIAGILGLLLGAGFAIMRESLDRRIRSEVDFAELLDVPLLAKLSYGKLGGSV
jgi:polysaccharide biosynthesis transport protein